MTTTSTPAAVSETVRWLRPYMAVVVVALTLVAALTPLAEDMPAFHRVAAPVAAAVMLAAWAVELSGIRWPRLVLILGVVLPNVWLTLIGHTSANNLFLILLLAWVGAAGSRAESVTAFALAFATVALGIGLDALDGQIAWAGWTSWLVGLVLVWLMALVIGREARLVAELQRLRADAEERTRHTAVLAERARLARELHDSVTQSLYGVSLYAEAAGRSLSDGEVQPAAANIQEIRATVQEALGEMRLLLFELRPPLLEEHGLTGAIQSRLQAVEARAGLATEFQDQTSERLPPHIEQELFRIVQEALNNVLKHAHATRVKVRLEVAAERVVLEVADNGLGFEPSLGGSGGLGLAGMRERAQRLGGSVQVESGPGAGTCVHVELPR